MVKNLMRVVVGRSIRYFDKEYILLQETTSSNTDTFGNGTSETGFKLCRYLAIDVQWSILYKERRLEQII